MFIENIVDSSSFGTRYLCQSLFINSMKHVHSWLSLKLAHTFSFSEWWSYRSAQSAFRPQINRSFAKCSLISRTKKMSRVKDVANKNIKTDTAVIQKYTIRIYIRNTNRSERVRRSRIMSIFNIFSGIFSFY
jgi:exo-beta-1,3-glucanase (GH17 family)